MSSTNDQTLKTYDQNISLYAKKSPTNLSDEFRAWFDTKFLNYNTSSEILEVGSGRGVAAKYIESKGHKVSRTDGSEGFVNLMRSEGVDAKLLNILTDDIIYDYDVILAEAVFLHFTTSELIVVLKKVFHALTNNGMVIFTLKKGVGSKIESEKMNGPRFFQYWQKKAIVDLLTKLKYDHIIVDEIDDYRSNKSTWLMVSAKRMVEK
jgi:2-polyprenyl-3-methyl-5-hydroxy-6-metoxy-1,4-benzoquinol methylase